MRSVFFLFFVLNFCATSVFSQVNADLRFDDNGQFKILQFTDTHINLTKNTNRDVYDRVRNIMEIEKPDLVVLTGDIVTGNNPEEGYRIFEKLFVEAGVPWTVTFGNHDSQNEMSRKELADFIQSLRFCMNKDFGETDGNSNFILTLGTEEKTEALLYFMDSNSYSTLQPQVGGWGWFTHKQVGWYRERSKAFTVLNGGVSYPALAFFHIPLPEYTDAWNNEKQKPFGERNEDECSPEINTGMFAAMLECGDVMGTFVGHDHINDYIAVHYNIALAYGRVSKVMKDENDPPAGARVIMLNEGKRSFTTWIRDLNGKKEQECTWPDSFKTN